MKDIRVADVMTRLVVTLRPQDTIQEAAGALLANRISGAPVVDEGRLVGVVSEADLVSAYAPPRGRGVRSYVGSDPLLFLLRGAVPQTPHYAVVGDVMTKQTVSVGPDVSVWEAASLIDRHGVRRVPVVDDQGRVIGVLARADLVRAMARSDEDVASSVLGTVTEILGEDSFEVLDVHATNGEVTLRGKADRRSTHDLALGIASHVPGVLDVIDELQWDWDDSKTDPAGPRGRDPWAVGPLVKETTS